MKKKVGIMSMQRIINYGSFLQAYALSNTIKNLGHDVEFVDFKIEPCLVEPGKYLSIEDIEPEYKEQFIIYKNFTQKFKNEYLKELNINERNERPELDTLVIGSDEVFNCLQSNPDVGYSLELFGKNNRAKRLISYAASCGHTTYERIVEFNKQDEISELLNKFNSISIRDKNSHRFVEHLSNLQPVENLDPVLIYDFSKEIKRNVNIDNYIIVYAYSFNLSDDTCNKIRQFAKKYNKKIVTIGSYQKCTDIFIDAHPLEVMDYFEKADFVITNTFHGTIFAIKSHVPFATVARPFYNNEKISDLLLRMNFLERKMHSYDDIEKLYNTPISFKESDNIINKEAVNTINYLKSNI